MSVRKPVLAAIACALLFAVYLADREYVRSGNVRRAREQRVIDFDAADAYEVILENEHGRFHLRKREAAEGTQWWLVEPKEMRASNGQVAALIDNIRGAKKSNSFQADDLSEYGLDPPEARVEIRAQYEGEEKEVALLIGGESVQIGRVHASLEGSSEVFTIGDWVRNQAMKDLQTLRDKTLLEFDPGAVERVQVEQRRNSFTIEKRPDKALEWWLVERDAPANSLMVARSLNLLATASVLEVIDDPTTPPVQLGLEPPLSKVRIETEAETYVIEVGGRIPGEDQLYVRSTDQPDLAIVRSSVVAELLEPVSDWGTRRLIWFAPEDFQEIKTSWDQEAVLLTKSLDAGWRFLDAEGVDLHERKVEELIRSLSTLSALDLLATDPSEEELREKWGVYDYSSTVEVTSKDGLRNGFRRGATDVSEGIVYLHRLQDNTVWSVNFTEWHKVFKQRADLADNRIFPDLVGRVSAARIVLVQKLWVLQKQNEVWRVRSPGEPAVRVSGLVAERFIYAAQELESREELLGSVAGQPSWQVQFLDENATVIYEMALMRDRVGRNLLRSTTGNHYVEDESLAMFHTAFEDLIEQAVEEEEQAGAGN